jgi:hypothetical protein
VAENEEQDENDEDNDNEEQDELKRMMRQTRRSHVVASPIVPAREDDRVLMKPLGDKYVNIFCLFDSKHDTHVFCFLSFSS